MNKIYIIIISTEADTEIVRDRIRSIGQNYVFWNNNWLVESTETSQQIYDRLTAEPYTHMSVFISELDLSNYYGRMKTALWKWIEDVNTQ